MSENKPREWWIDEGHMDDDYSCVSSEPVENCIHVIEKSAYDKLKGLQKDHEDDWKRIELLSIIEFQHQTILSVYQTSSEHSEKWNWCKETIEATAARLEALGGGE